MPRTRLTAAQRREQLLDATKTIVLAGGFHAVSIEAVARGAGITRPIVYAHFDNLEGLLEALFDRESERALAQLGAIVTAEAPPDAPADALAVALRRYLEVAIADPQTWRLFLVPPEGAPPALREHVERARAVIVGQLAQAIAERDWLGRPSPDPELTARTLSALADEAVRLVLTDPARFAPERVLAHTRWLLAGLSGSS
ncbi:MAG: TetR/AcrR family transcriptional regulator [Solirubrobacterales bacterium]|nr:TetR/AcrR family transcriptional regulator [Solirubrobacterales bacterium]